MFVNYLKERARDSPFNIAVARMILGTFLIWKLLTYNWDALGEWPVVVFEMYSFAAPPVVQEWLPVEQWVAVVLLVLFVFGYRLGLVSFLSALLVAHLGTVRFTHRISGETDALFIGVYFLLFFGLYRTADELSLDGFRRTRNRSLIDLNELLQSSSTDTYRMTALTGGLLAVATIYFGSGLDKVRAGPFSEWVKRENLTRYIVIAQERFGIRTEIAHLLHDVAVQLPLLMDVLATGTIVLEMGFLLAILSGISITPFVLALLGMHTVIALAMGPFFTDQYVFLLLFFNWEWLHERLTVNSPIAVVYDEQCYFCARCLYLIKLVDTDDRVQFHTRSTAPGRCGNHTGVSAESAICVLDDGTVYKGSEGVQRLIRQFRVLLPIAWVMGMSPAFCPKNRSLLYSCGYARDVIYVILPCEKEISGYQAVDEIVGYRFIPVAKRCPVRRTWIFVSSIAASWVSETLPLQTHSSHVARYFWLVDSAD